MMAWLLIYFALSAVVLPFTLILLSANKTEEDYDALALDVINESELEKTDFSAIECHHSFTHSHTPC